jgi:hypothetical protein
MSARFHPSSVIRHPSWRVMLLGAALWIPAGGCRNCDLVEAELRTRERELREARDALERTELLNEALQREVHALRPGAVTPISPELASQMYTLKEIVLGRGTGGYSNDCQSWDDALQVVIEPRDPDGQAIKAPGSLHVEAVQINPQGLKSPLSAWDIPPNKLRRTWQNGLLSAGYYVLLPWNVPPTDRKVRVTARFTLADGRLFEADKDVTIRLRPEPKAPTGPMLVPEEPIVPGPGPVEVEPLPPNLLPTPQKMSPSGPDAAPELGKGGTTPADWPTTSWKRTPTPVPLGQAVQLLRPVSGR